MNRKTANNDHTVLSLACAGGHLPIVELLLARGADPTHILKVNKPLCSAHVVRGPILAFVLIDPHYLTASRSLTSISVVSLYWAVFSIHVYTA